MSVYSGFATRLLETQYGGLLCKLVSLLERRVVSSIRGGTDNTDYLDSDQWTLSFTAVYRGMRRMEGQKYQPPKYSGLCRELAEIYGVAGKEGMARDESMSSSRMSGTAKDWEATMHQYLPLRVESMLIEESKITPSPSRLPDFATPILEETVLRPAMRAGTRRKVSYSPPAIPKIRNRPLSIRTTPRNLDPLDSTTRTIPYSRAEDTSDSSNKTTSKKKKPRKIKLAEMYQDRGYTKLLAELRE